MDGEPKETDGTGDGHGADFRKRRFLCVLCGAVGGLSPHAGMLWCRDCERKVPLDLAALVEYAPDASIRDVVFGKWFLDAADEFYRADPSGRKQLRKLADHVREHPSEAKGSFENEERVDAGQEATTLLGYVGRHGVPKVALPHLVDALDRLANERPFRLRAGYCCTSCGGNRLSEYAPHHWRCTQCKRQLETPAWLARRDTHGQYEDPIFGERFTRELSHAYKRSKAPDAVFAEHAAHRGVPSELWPALKEEVRRLVRPDEILMDNYKRIVFGQDGIYVETEKKSAIVIDYPFEVRRVLTIEGERRIVVSDALGEFTGTISDIRRRLEENNQVMSSKDCQDVLAHIARNCPNRGSASYTYGVYADGDRLYVPTEISPKEGDQREAVERILPHLGVQPTPAHWEACEAFLSFFEARERYTAPPLAAFAPLAPILRRRRRIVPLAYLYSREGGTGKSKMVEVLTRRLWNMDVESAGTLNSPFRFVNALDAIALPWGFDEAEKFKWDEHGAALKQAMESEFTERRGTQKLTTVRYRSRATPLLTGNTLPAASGTVLRRAVVPHFNETRKALPQDVKRSFDVAIERFPTVGPALTRAGLDLCGASEKKLMEILRRHEDEISACYTKRHGIFAEAGRAGVWAIVYYGARVWHHASKGLIPLPTIEAFCDDVVAPVEATANEVALDPLGRLRSFIAQYRARTRVEETAMAGLFARHYWRERDLDGDWVTAAGLDLYNRDHQRTPEAVIPTLKELGQMVARKHRIPEGDMLPGGQAPRRELAGRQARVVFLPAEEPSHGGQASLVASSGDDGDGAGGNGHGATVPVEVDPEVFGQGSRVVQVLELVRAHQGPDGHGAEEEVLLAKAVDLGIPRPSASAALRRLLETGKVSSPTWGSYRAN